MIPVVVQTSGKKTSLGVTSDSASLPSPVTPGNHVILLISSLSGSTAGIDSVTDNQGNPTYDLYDGHVTTRSAAIAIQKAAAAAGTFTVTINFTNSSSADWAILEVSNLDPTSWSDQANAQFTSFADPAVVTAPAPNAVADELVVAVASPYSGDISGTPSTGYTDAFTDANITTGGRGSYKVVSGIETSSASFPYATANFAVLALMTFKGAPDATGAILHPQICLG